LGIEHALAVFACARRWTVVAEIQPERLLAGRRVERVELARVEPARGVDLALVNGGRRHRGAVAELHFVAGLRLSRGRRAAGGHRAGIDLRTRLAEVVAVHLL